MTMDSDTIHLRCSYNRASGVVSRNGLLMAVAPLCGAESDRIVACRWLWMYSLDDICADCCDIHESIDRLEGKDAYNGSADALAIPNRKAPGRRPKLAPEAVHDIRTRHETDSDATFESLALENGVSVSTIHNAIYAVGVYGHGAYAITD